MTNSICNSFFTNTPANINGREGFVIQKILVAFSTYPAILFVGIAIPFRIKSSILSNSDICSIRPTVLAFLYIGCHLDINLYPDQAATAALCCIFRQSVKYGQPLHSQFSEGSLCTDLASEGFPASIALFKEFISFTNLRR